MAIRQTLLYLFQTVLFVALFGSFTAKGGNPDTPSTNSPLLVAEQDYSPKNANRQASETVIPQSSQRIDELEAKCEKLERTIKKDHRHIVFLFIALIAVIAGTFLMNRKWKNIQAEIDSRQNQQLRDLKREIDKQLSAGSSKIQQEMDNLRRANTAKTVSQPSGQPQTTPSPSNDTQRTPTPATQPQKETAKSSCKYFMLQESNGQMFVRDRNLKSEPSGWFAMEISGDRASYDINPKMTSTILADIATLKLCANNFETNPNATSIKTVKKGTLKRDGQSWVVTDKITIKLV